MPHIYPQNCPFPSTIFTPGNTPIHRLTPLTTPNGIQIQSAVLPQYTIRTDRQTDRPIDRWARRQVSTKTHFYALYIDRSDPRLIIASKRQGRTIPRYNDGRMKRLKRRISVRRSTLPGNGWRRLRDGPTESAKSLVSTAIQLADKVVTYR